MNNYASGENTQKSAIRIPFDMPGGGGGGGVPGRALH